MDTSNGKICTPDYPPLPSGLNNNMGLFFANIAWWGNDSQHAYFIDQERGDRVVRLVEFDTHTGHTRVLFEEQSETHINILTGDYLSPTAHRYLASEQ